MTNSKIINSKNLVILISIVFIVLHYIIRTYQYNNWDKILGWDVLAYYIYLPFTFIYNDPGMVNQEVVAHIFKNYNPSGTFYQAYQLPNGNWISMYSIGFAILFAPFFFIAHLWASLSGNYPADGFSYPYQFTIGNGLMIYIVAGIFFIRKVLLKFFTDNITSLVLIFLLLGTNYFHEASSDEAMPHAMLFAVNALILLLTIQWHEKPVLWKAAILGLLIGFAIIARPSEVFIALIPVLWNVWNKELLLVKWDLIKNNLNHLLVAFLAFMVIPIFQMVFWKIITGGYIFSTYQNTEGFDWDGQYIYNVLFHYKKSWFLYTPMIILPIIGIYYTYKKAKPIFPAICIFFLANFYLIASWAAWWQGGSFGMRYFVESYAVMAIPFGFFLSDLLTRRTFIKITGFILASFFLFLNLFQTWQFDNWMIDGYSMTKEYYWKIFLKTKVTDDDKKLKEIQREFTDNDNSIKNPNDYLERTIGFFDFDSLNTIPVEKEFLDSVNYLSAPFGCRLTKDRVFSPTLKMQFKDITSKEHAFIKVSLDYFPIVDFKDNPASLVIYFNHSDRYNLKWKGWNFSEQSYKLNQWNHLEVEYLTPYPYSLKDEMRVFVYLQGDKNFVIDNMRIKAFERKW